ncbi:Isochorismatase family protein [Gimesia panareensis]|uniref:Isochorismatase family protein n=1 Tax=Gimesia panareensis TaxID=2527978 RepID=A0A518FM75_9PLAN|nr:hypothetical protein [Gimesia panareensis]QDV17410.1 Isochorismatase family protein [Gimesia panareensis]
MDQRWFFNRGKRFLAAVLLLALVAGAAEQGLAEKKADSKPIPVVLQKRSADASGKYRPVKEAVYWKPEETAIIVCDMWDDHTCKQAAKRVAEMAPAMNETLKAARDKGVFIIHAPSGRMNFYDGTPQRQRAIDAPFAKAPLDFKWKYWNDEKEGQPLDFVRAGGCGCKVPCKGWVPDETGLRHWKGEKIPWTRQIATIDIADEDTISDNGQEVYNLLEQRGIKNVVLMGVHTNLCVCGRPFGLRQMVYQGKNAVLCRDLTDSLFQQNDPPISHFRGTELVVEHIEKRICPTITSTTFTGKPEFHFDESATH